ncbi:MAG: dihydrolipoyl dehydrogenase [Candidatus Omnitrophica bacterium]|nr:dihydrolipoyl dehydrogenase [Candidatus Omnitrophota bacterium]
MTATQSFDVAVLGGGPGGYVAAIRAAQLGKSVALVEKNKLGGTCLHVGCIPTKGLIQNSDVLRTCRESEQFGIKTGEVTFDWSAVIQRQWGIVERLHKGVQFLMKKNNITVVNGFGRLATSNRIEVDSSGEKWSIEADKIIIATGSVAKSLPGVELDEDRIVSNVGALAMKSPPKRLLVIGSGAVGVEFASIYHVFGSEVTILEYLPRLVPLEDPEVSQQLERFFKKSRIKCLTGVAVQKVERTDDGVRAIYRKGEEELGIEGDVCLVAVGRRAVIEGIGLESTQVKTDRGVILTDAYCRTDDPSIYAIGDAIGNYQLAHVAEVEGWLAASHLAGAEAHPIDYSAVPRCTYCYPQIGSVGLSEAEAREQGIPVEVGKSPFMANGKAMALGHTDGFSKVIRHAETGELLGAHIIGPEATELIMEFVVANQNRVSVKDLAHTIHAHPTLTEVSLEALHAAVGEPVHG